MPKKNDGRIVMGRSFGSRNDSKPHLKDVLTGDQISKARAALNKDDITSSADVQAVGIKTVLKKLEKLPFITKAVSVPGRRDEVEIHVGNQIGRGHPGFLFA